MRERDVQRDVVAFYRKLGCFVYVLSQGRPTRQTPGLPDLYVQTHTSAWWHESKTPAGKLRAAQVDFADREMRAGGDVVVGGLSAAQTYAKALGLVA